MGVNGGDLAFWRDRSSYSTIDAPPAEWPKYLTRRIDEDDATDLVVYGDTRPLHAGAIEIAKARGLTVHCFEEGYLRPYWVTYERDGSNGNSALVDLTIDDIDAALKNPAANPAGAPSNWGEFWHHSYYGCRYHFEVWRKRKRFPHYQGHRNIALFDEALLNLRRLVAAPGEALMRMSATDALVRSARPYHVVLMQLAHDANMREHSCYDGSRQFVEDVVAGFSNGAPDHHQLVFKAHPFEDGREAVPQAVADAAKRHGISERVWYVHGGRLGRLLDRARSAVTVNSTAAQQALWRGLPVKAFGRAIYDKPGITSPQALPAFFRDPTPPDRAIYRAFRQFLLETSQIPGGYYSAKGRRDVVRRVVDRMLAKTDPYLQLEVGKDTDQPKLRAV